MSKTENNQVTISQQLAKNLGIPFGNLLKQYKLSGYKIQHQYDDDLKGKVIILDK